MALQIIFEKRNLPKGFLSQTVHRCVGLSLTELWFGGKGHAFALGNLSVENQLASADGIPFLNPKPPMLPLVAWIIDTTCT